MLKGIADLPLAIKLMVLSFLCPTELSLYIAGLRLPPHRVVLIALLPWALWRIATSRRIRIRAFDLVLVGYVLWTFAAYATHTEGTEGMVYGGSLVVESLGGYAISRAFIRDIETFCAALRLLVLSVVLAGLVALPDMLLGEYVTHNLLRSVVGGEPMPEVEYRMGLARAASVFDHPIHLGTYCAGLLAMIYFAEQRELLRLRSGLIVALGTLTAMSSAPLLCLGVQVALLAWERLTRRFSFRVTTLLAVILGAFAALTVLSTRSPFVQIATGLTFDPWTGYYRTMIWQYGMESVMNYPLLGIGLADWERPQWMVSSTVDAFWLVTMMRSGIPALMLLLAGIGLLLYRVATGMRRRLDARTLAVAKGWIISLVALSLVACTVHFWNVLYAYFFFFLGTGGVFADPLKVAKKAATTARARPADASGYAPAPLLAGPGAMQRY